MTDTEQKVTVVLSAEWLALAAKLQAELGLANRSQAIRWALAVAIAQLENVRKGAKP